MAVVVGTVFIVSGVSLLLVFAKLPVGWILAAAGWSVAFGLFVFLCYGAMKE